MIERFSSLLGKAMDDSELKAVELEGLLRERGTENINFRRISEYLHGVSTPPFDKARVLMDTLDIPIGDEELKESLELNRELIREEREEILNDRYNRSVTVTIRFRNIGKSSKMEDIIDNEEMLYRRVTELFGDEKNLKKYVERLIKKDLENYLISEEDTDE